MKYKLFIPLNLLQAIAVLPPGLKRQIRTALDEIVQDPQVGKPLRDDLLGCRSYRVGRYRIVYWIHEKRIEVEIIDVGRREIIYERSSVIVRRLPPFGNGPR